MVEYVSSQNYLGPTLGGQSTFQGYVNKIGKRLRSWVGSFYVLRQTTTYKTMKMIYFALFQSIIVYAITSWGSTYKRNQMFSDRHEKIFFFKLVGKITNQSCRSICLVIIWKQNLMESKEWSHQHQKPLFLELKKRFLSPCKIDIFFRRNLMNDCATEGKLLRNSKTSRFHDPNEKTRRHI